jgi:pectate lyase
MFKLLLILSLFLCLGGCVNGEKPDPNLPPVNEETSPWYQNPFGFASLTVTDRKDEVVREVGDEVAFLDALLSAEVKVIKITADLDMGDLYVSGLLSLQGRSLTDYRQVYRSHHHRPKLHPLLQESGIGMLRIVQRDGLLIYSESGHTLKHLCIIIDASRNIVFRNLRLSELWEWDEIDAGAYKTNDWDYFTIEKSEGIWFDHLSFDQAYDGIIDVKEGCSNLTLSFSRLEFVPNAFIQAQINYLEAHREDNHYYRSLREKGLSEEDLLKWASYQKKGFNLGNTTDGEGYEEITFTFHHLEISNLQDRLPRIRKGDAHLYQIILDNTGIDELSAVLNAHQLSIVNQGIVTTEGGAVLMENSIFRNVAVPLKSHQDSNSDSRYTGKYQILNSELIRNNQSHFGSSGDGRSLWYPSNPHPALPFAFRNYETLPYAYELLDVYYLPAFFEENPTGAGTLSGINWLEIKPLHIKGE